MSSRPARTTRMSRTTREAERERTATALAERLHAADSAMESPAGLWERVRDGRSPVPEQSAGPPRSSSTAGAPPVPPVRWLRRPGRPLVAAVAATAVVVLIAVGSWLLQGPGRQTAPQPAASAPGVVMTVHNAEPACHELRTLECALRLARSPDGVYADHGNAAGRVWHGERLSAVCVATDGTLVKDESGVSSTRWYLARKSNGSSGWLPGVRTRNTAEVPPCSEDQRALRPR